MAIPGLFKSQSHRKFEFIPRYYNEQKEKREERIRDIKREMGVEYDSQQYHTRISRGSMRGYINKNRSVQKKSNIRLFVILGIFLLITYVLFFR